ncbi:MAG: SIS domain-containing protein [Acidobacteria bacterium]|nr:SIS domain-containing protein [Acidobacteriota bacterium]MBS1865153.1 SIS domain-containing protein [Acidobacteriota bacterium]
MPASDSPARKLHTLTEILSQPETWLASQRALATDSCFQKAVTASTSRKEWLFVGCGTSFYLAEAAAASWTTLTGQRARALPASEVLLFPHLSMLQVPDLQVVVISRSGKTSEAVRAGELLTAKYKLPTLGITCAKDSELAKVCQLTIAIPSADEESMVMTRSFTSMLLALVELAASQSNAGSFSSAIEAVAGSLAAKIESFNARIEGFVAKHTFADYIYLGQGPFFAIAREAALKVTEMSCSYAQPYHTLEFRHGPKSVVAPQTCLTFFLSESGMDDESEVLEEMKDLGGTIVAICNHASDAVRAASDLVFEIEADAPELALAAPFIAPAQLLGFHSGVKKGFNPDEPKNLSRVVILD